MKQSFKNILYYILGSIQAIVALGAIPAGLGFLSDTTGAAMGNSVEMLAGSPLKSFLIPGLFLLIVHGFCSVAGAILSFGRKAHAGIVGLILGIILILWIIIQVWIISLSSFMQPLFFGIAIVEAVLGWILWKKPVIS